MQNVILITYTVSDIAAAKTFFTELNGCEPYADMPAYTGYRIGDLEIGLVPTKDHTPGGLAYWAVDDIRASLDALVAAGGTIVQDVTDVGYGMLIARIKEPSGSLVGLRQQPKG